MWVCSPSLSYVRPSDARETFLVCRSCWTRGVFKPGHLVDTLPWMFVGLTDYGFTDRSSDEWW